ncbi:MAG: SPOR domain-containing protein, partial [Bartonella sp.]|nr:SPOR domain-containing protein [Bartonella sp.]
AQEKIDPVVTSSAPTNTRTKQSGWTIQIGSLPNQEQANTMLANAARAAGNRVLASATPSTQVTAKHGQQYYRARFVGFPTKKAALEACTVLKKANFNCYALSQ